MNQDYKLSLNLQVKQTTDGRGGHNKEIFMLNVKTFKSLCLKAGTKKADEIHDYYLKMEETIHQVIQEESDELKLQLDQAKLEITKNNNYESSSALDNPVKNEKQTNGHYYMLYEDCSHDLKTGFTHKPVLYKDGVGQFDQDSKLIREFVCKFDCIKQLKMSDKSLAKALDTNTMYNNHYFRRIGSKLQCISITSI